MAESLQRIRVRRALAGQHPASSTEVIQHLEETVTGWNAAPTPFAWGGKRYERRVRAKQRRLVVHPANGVQLWSSRSGWCAMTLRLRALSDEETSAVRQLAYARTTSVRTAERAGIVWLASQGKHVPAIATELRLAEKTVRRWLERFNDRGLAGLEDAPRSGRPPTYTPEEASGVIAAVLTKPADLDLPFANWTLDRLVAYLGAQQAITMKRSRVDELLLAEGVRWRTQETWFGERVDPAFAEKRGRSSNSTPHHRPIA
jgi:transposase